MNKLSEKQKMLVYVGIGVAIFLVFSVLSYMDFQTMEELENKTKAVNGQVKKLQGQKSEIETKFIPRLFSMKTEYDRFQGKLPTKKELENILETFECWRTQIKQATGSDVGAWGIKVAGNEQIVEEKKEAVAANSRGRGKAQDVSLFQTSTFNVNVLCSFQQFGCLLDLIENAEKFYAVTDFKIPKVVFRAPEKTVADTGKLEAIGKMSFTMLSYFLKGEENDKILASVKTFLDKADKNAGKKYAKILEGLEKKQATEDQAAEEAKQKKEAAGIQFHNIRLLSWRPETPNPFVPKLTMVQKQELVKKGSEPEKIKPGLVKIQPPVLNLTLEELKEQFTLLKRRRDSVLDPQAQAKSWSTLREEMGQSIQGHNYETALEIMDTQLARLKIPESAAKDIESKRDMQRNVSQMLAESQKWRRSIENDDLLGSLEEFIKETKLRVDSMDQKYKIGKEQRQIPLLVEGKKIYQQFNSSLKGYLHKLDRTPADTPRGKEIHERLRSVDERAQLSLEKLERQIKLLDYSQKLEKNMQGIIHYLDQKNNKKLSVAYINREPKKVGDPLDEGFQVRSITQDGIELQYGKQDTVMVYVPRVDRLQKISQLATERIETKRDVNRK